MQETWDFICNHLKDDVRKLALQAHRHPLVNMPFAMDQISGYQTALQKIPTFAQTTGIRYPHRLSMEQCSSEQTARYKAQIIAETPSATDTFVDLTAGFGVDFSFISSQFRQAVAVERQEYLCEIQRHNLPLLGLTHAQVAHADAEDYLQKMQPVNWLFLDPARRDANGGKVVSIPDCEPDVSAWEEQLLGKAEFVMVKLSPMLDISLALHTLKHVKEVHVISVQNECKELLFILDRNTHSIEDIPLFAVNLHHQEKSLFRFTLREEKQAMVSYAPSPQHYLYEPNSALIKAGAFRSVAERMNLQKLHPNSHLYTSEQLIPDFPGRAFIVETYSGFGKKELKSLLQEINQANLAVRNFPATAEELRKRLKLKDGGETYLFATTLNGGNEKILIRCRKA
ncbi:MAG: SAM-dependent methyltransferase [Bacteroidaceae bacterium]|nr:SAM-dependent methyltransferase [Bacteroidaceae bacterium]